MQRAPGVRLRPVLVGLIATAAACGGGNLGSGGTAGTSGTGTAGATAGTTGVAGTSGTAGTIGTAGVAGDVGDAGSGGPPPGGTGGAIAGSGGSPPGGSGGAIAGAGGTGGTGGLPACGAGTGGVPPDVVAVAIVDSDGNAVSSMVTSPVAIATIEACTTATCPSVVYSTDRAPILVDDKSTRIGLTSEDARSWTLYLRYSAMPTDLLKMGETYGLTVQASADNTFFKTLDQTIILARGPDLVLLASNAQRFGGAPLPALDAFGVSVSDGGAVCDTNPTASMQSCRGILHAVHVIVGTDAANLLGGTTTKLGWLSFTNASFTESRGNNCDSKATTTVAGFRSP